MGDAPKIGNTLVASPQVFYILSDKTPDLFYFQRYIIFFLKLIQVRKITFTGSTAVGKKLMAGAAETVKKVIVLHFMFLQIIIIF